MKNFATKLIYTMYVIILLWIISVVPFTLTGGGKFYDFSLGLFPQGYYSISCFGREYGTEFSQHVAWNEDGNLQIIGEPIKLRHGGDQIQVDVNDIIGYGFNLHQIVFHIRTEEGDTIWVAPMEYAAGKHCLEYLGSELNTKTKMVFVDFYKKPQYLSLLNFLCDLILAFLYPVFLYTMYRQRSTIKADRRLLLLSCPLYFLPLLHLAVHWLSSLFMSLLRALF